MYILNKPEARTILFCNPNAGFYEFAFYQSEWVEFYQRLGVNLMLWNYPGYGRTQGRPSIKKTLKAGEAVIDYLRSEKNSKVLGVHGESLGGCIASYLANKCNLNFLFADRTFASLSEAALYNFGKLAYFGLKIAGAEDINTSSHFLEAKCYKVLSCDPWDNMIKDLGSLKNGVSRGLIYKNLPLTHILLEEHMKDFHSSLVRIQYFIAKLNQIGNISNENTGAVPVSTYQPLQDDSDLFEVEGFRNAIFKLKNILNGIDAGGLSLLQCLKSNQSEKALVAWITVLDVWGTSSQSFRVSSVQLAVDLLRNVVKELAALTGVIGIKKEVIAVHLALDAIKTHLEIRLDHSDSRSLGTSQELKYDVDYERAGNLISLNCGHGGPYSSQEKIIYEQHLLKSKFTTYNY